MFWRFLSCVLAAFAYVALVILLSAHRAHAQARAFPGAKGWGSTSRHAWGCGTTPQLCRVTSAAAGISGSNNAGTFDYCWTREYPRVIAFETSGAPVVNKELKSNNDCVWVAGQTAPAPGFQIHSGLINTLTGGATLDKVLIQHIAILGSNVGTSTWSTSCDSRTMVRMQDTSEFILDHVFVGFSTDQLMSAGEGSGEILVSNSLAAFPLHNSCHSKGAHGYGPLFYDNVGLTWYRSAIAHAAQRQIRLRTLRYEAIHGVFFNGGPNHSDWTSIGDGTVDSAILGHMTIRESSFTCGANSGTCTTKPITAGCTTGTANNCGLLAASDVYISGVKHRNSAGTLINTDWNAVSSRIPRATHEPVSGMGPADSGDFDTIDTEAAAFVDMITNKNIGMRPAEAKSGLYDAAYALQIRALNDIKNRTGNWINSPADVGGLPVVAVNTRPLSSVAGGPPSLANVDSDGDGFTDFEDWVHDNFDPLVLSQPAPTPTPTPTATGTPTNTPTPTATPTATPTPVPLGAPAILNGFESGDTTEFNGTAGTFSVTATCKRSGSFGLRLNPAAGGTASVALTGYGSTGTVSNSAPNSASCYGRKYFSVATAPSAGSVRIVSQKNSGNTDDKLQVKVNSSRQLVILDSADTVIATTTAAVTLNTPYRLEWYATNGTSGAWSVSLYTDATTPALVETESGTANLGATNCGPVYLGTEAIADAAFDVCIDDVQMDTNQSPGPGSIVRLFPNAQGTTNGWSSGTNASDYQEVDEVSADTTTYVANSGAATQDFNIQDTATAGVTGNDIRAIRATARLIEPANTVTTTTTRMGVRSGASTSLTDGRNTTSSYTSINKLIANDPATGQPFTSTGLDNLQITLTEEGASLNRATTAYVTVDFVPAAPTPTPTPTSTNTPTNTPTGTPTNTPTVTPTFTPEPEPTPVPTATPNPARPGRKPFNRQKSTNRWSYLPPLSPKYQIGGECYGCIQAGLRQHDSDQR